MSDLIAFNNEEDFRRVMRAVQFFERQRYGNTANKPSPIIDGIYAKVTDVIESNIGGEDVYLEAKGVQVEFDAETGEFIDIDNDPYVFDTDLLDSAGATLFNTTNITSQTDMEVDQVYLLQYSPHIRETSDWFVVQAGGGEGNSRAYIIITSVTDAENYTGNVLAGPEDSTVINTGVTIKSINATSNPFEVGYSVYADTDGTTYYIDGYLLG